MRTRPYTVKEVADILGVSEKTVLKLIGDGKLAAFRPGKRDYRIMPLALEDFIARQRHMLLCEQDERRQAQKKEGAE